MADRRPSPAFEERSSVGMHPGGSCQYWYDLTRIPILITTIESGHSIVERLPRRVLSLLDLGAAVSADLTTGSPLLIKLELVLHAATCATGGCVCSGDTLPASPILPSCFEADAVHFHLLEYFSKRAAIQGRELGRAGPIGVVERCVGPWGRVKRGCSATSVISPIRKLMMSTGLPRSFQKASKLRRSYHCSRGQAPSSIPRPSWVRLSMPEPAFGPVIDRSAVSGRSALGEGL